MMTKDEFKDFVTYISSNVKDYINLANSESFNQQMTDMSKHDSVFIALLTEHVKYCKDSFIRIEKYLNNRSENKS